MNEAELQQAKEAAQKFRDLLALLKQDLQFNVAPADLRDGQLVDIMVFLRELKTVAEGREKLMGEVLKVRHKEALAKLEQAYKKDGLLETLTLKGEATNGLVYSFVTQQRLDMEALEQEMGAEWMEEHKKATEFFQARKAK